MDHNLVIMLLILGLIVGVIILRYIRQHVISATTFPGGPFSFIWGIVGVLPAILITLGIIDKTTSTVLISIIYFFVFIIGAMLVDSKGERKDRKDKGGLLK